MADEQRDQAADGTREPETPAPAPEEPEGQEGAPQGAAEGPDGEGLTDRHGQPAISAGKYERDMAAKDEEIARLTARVEEMSRTEDGRKRMQEEIAKLKSEIASDKVDHALELAGCVNVKAARAVLDDCDGDVGRLKAECPYLFRQDEKQQRAGSTGLPPRGPSDGGRRAKAREAAGLPPKE